MYTFIGITIEGKRRFLTYDIDVNYDTDFWMKQFKNISRRETEKVLYITLVKSFKIHFAQYQYHYFDT